MKTFILTQKKSFPTWILKAVLIILLSGFCPTLGNTTPPLLEMTPSVKLDCTVYYTPKESGFVAGKGFDLRLVTKPGLKGRKFAADFLRAVQMEGHGAITHPQGSRSYIYYNGKWGYTEYPRGTKNIRLIPLQSCAVSIPTFPKRGGKWFKPQQDQLPAELAKAVWRVVDVGGGVRHQQIDLYWGEDNPRGPGQDIYRPAGTDFTGRRGTLFASARELHAFNSLPTEPSVREPLLSNYFADNFANLLFPRGVE
jgi:hypothetical protein